MKTNTLHKITLQTILFAATMVAFSYVITINPFLHVPSKRTDTNETVSLPKVVNELNSIHEAKRKINARRYYLKKVDKGYSGSNYQTGIAFHCAEKTLSVKPVSAENNDAPIMTLQLAGLGRSNEALIQPQGKPDEIVSETEINYTYSNITLQYQNTAEGLRQNFILPDKPDGSGEINIVLSNLSTYKLLQTSETSISFLDKDKPMLSYYGLKAWDKNHKPIAAKMQVQENQIVLAINDNDAVYPITIDPITGNTSTITPNTTVEACAGVGDINGDGYQDIAAGNYAHFDNTPPGYMTGIMEIYLGGANGFPNSPSYTYIPNGLNACFGSSFAAMGDLDNDGLSDFIVGASGGGNNIGNVYVFRGRKSSTTPVRTPILISGFQTGSLFGRAVCNAGDINGDGWNDILTGAYLYRSTPQSNPEGRFYVFTSHYNSTTQTLSFNLNYQETGPSYSTGFVPRFGVHFTGGADINGDGYDDIAIKHEQNRDLFIYYGSSAGITSTNKTTINNITGIGTSSEGKELAMGDYNHDGYADLVFGAPALQTTVSPGVTLTGGLYLLYGSASGISVPSPITPFAAFDGVGFEVANIGDVNGDRIEDFAASTVSSTYPSDKIYVFNGNNPSPSPIPTQTLVGTTIFNGLSISTTREYKQGGDDLVTVDANSQNTTGRNVTVHESISDLGLQKKRLYVNNFTSIIGNAMDEQHLLHYAANSGYSKLILYGLEEVLAEFHPTNPRLPVCPYSNGLPLDLPGKLRDFMVTAKNQYSLEIGVISEDYNLLSVSIPTFENQYSNAATFDIIELEYEFWNDQFNAVSGIPLTTQRINKWNTYENYITNLYNQYHSTKIVESYISPRIVDFAASTGNVITQSRVFQTIATMNETVLIANYIDNPQRLALDANDKYLGYKLPFGNIRDCLIELSYYKQLSGTPNKLDVSVIFESGCTTMGGWLASGGNIDEAFYIFYKDYRDFMKPIFIKSKNVLFTNNINIEDPTGFKYTSLLNPYCDTRKLDDVNACVWLNGFMAFNTEYIEMNCNLPLLLSNLTGNGDFTIEMDVELQQSNNTTATLISAMHSGNPTDNFILAYDNSTGNEHFWVERNGIVVYTSSTIRINGICNRVSLVYNNSTQMIDLMVDGQVVPAVGVIQPMPALTPVMDKLWFGADATGTYTPFEGKVSDIRMWDVRRTPTDIILFSQVSLDPNTAGLIGYWKLDEQVGRIAKDNKHHPMQFPGKIVSGLNHIYNVACKPYISNFARNFNGFDKYLTVPVNQSCASSTSLSCVPCGPEHDNGITIEAWINPAAKSASTAAIPYTILSNIDISSQSGFTFGLDANTNPVFQFGNGAIYGPVANCNIGSFNILGQCTHIAVVVEENTLGNYDLTFYMNGSMIGCTIATSVSASTHPESNLINSTGLNFMRIGSTNTYINNPASGNACFSGMIDEVRLWKTSKDQSSIADHYDNFIKYGLSWLYGYWRLDEQSGNTVHNSAYCPGNITNGYDGLMPGVDTHDPDFATSCTMFSAYQEFIRPFPTTSNDHQIHQGEKYSNTLVDKPSGEQQPILKTSVENRLYPNPSSHYIYVTNIEDQICMIYDMYGKEVSRQSVIKTQIDISELSQGSYIILVKNKDLTTKYLTLIKE